MTLGLLSSAVEFPLLWKLSSLNDVSFWNLKTGQSQKLQYMYKISADKNFKITWSDGLNRFILKYLPSKECFNEILEGNINTLWLSVLVLYKINIKNDEASLLEIGCCDIKQSNQGQDT